MTTTGEIELVGRLVHASNGTFLGRIHDGAEEVRVVYKPVSGERPLWDFPDGTLAGREIATYLLSDAVGWDVVPPTWLGEGPFGPGMVQRWVDADPTAADVVDVVPQSEVPGGWREAFEGYDAADRPVAVIHADSPVLRRMAVFDVLVNNADRKGGHILVAGADRVLGVDHGLTFHVDHKLRTVLWGWAGEPLAADELALVAATRDAVAGDLADRLGEHVAGGEVAALLLRCDRLLETGLMPTPPDGYPAIPWPPL